VDSCRELECQIRDIINHPRTQHAIMTDRRDWMQLCASLDVIGDTELAIASYSRATFADDPGVAYLLVFGVYQACFLQHLGQMGEVLKIVLPSDIGLTSVRNTRNDIVGHPTRRGSPKSRTSHAISRPTLAQWTFNVLSTDPITGKIAFRSVDVRQDLESQRRGVCEQLRFIRNTLEQRERTHAMTFAHEKLADIFPATLEYHCGKLFEGTDRASESAVAKANLELVHEWVEKFRTALINRGELLGNEWITHHFEQLRNPFERLRSFFAGNSPLNADDAYALAFFLRAKVQELAELAREIDERYAEAKSA
jgi:hypothetical protein